MNIYESCAKRAVLRNVECEKVLQAYESQRPLISIHSTTLFCSKLKSCTLAKSLYYYLMRSSGLSDLCARGKFCSQQRIISYMVTLRNPQLRFITSAVLEYGSYIMLLRAQVTQTKNFSCTAEKRIRIYT